MVARATPTVYGSKQLQLSSTSALYTSASMKTIWRCPKCKPLSKPMASIPHFLYFSIHPAPLATPRSCSSVNHSWRYVSHNALQSRSLTHHIAQVLKVILWGMSSLTNPGCATPATNGKLWKVKEVTLGVIAFAAIIVSPSLLSETHSINNFLHSVTFSYLLTSSLRKLVRWLTSSIF